MLDAVADVQGRTLSVSLLDHNLQDDTPVVVRGTDSEIGTLQRLTTMWHLSLPKLVEYGFVEWDEAANEVTKGPTFAEIRPLLELLEDHADECPADWL